MAYVDQPAVHWAIPREVDRPDWGVRQGAVIRLRAIDPTSMSPTGAAVDFLPSSFCPDNNCDYGHLAASHDGSRLAFECRRPIGDQTIDEQAWNLCIAEIASDGRALNPRFLLPHERRHRSSTSSRTSPFGLYDENGGALRGNYDIHHMVRRLNDQHPAFSPDDEWVYFSTRGPDPITGTHAARTYHGFEHINQVVGFHLESETWTRPYLNEGGVADFPVFLQNGHLALHTWNLERTDRHMIQQVGLDGDGTLPVLFGRLQGTNQWAGFQQLNNGSILGMTGRRRAQIEVFVPFYADHTLGTGSNINPALSSFAVLDQDLDDQIVEFGFCEAPPGGPNCRLGRFYDDPAWSPDGRALIAYTPTGVPTHHGHDMYRDYSSGTTTEDRLASLEPHLPRDLGIHFIDHRGVTEELFAPATGRSLRYPTWVGRRSAPVPAARPTTHAGGDGATTLHIADVPIWFSFDIQDEGAHDSYKSGTLDRLDRIVALRVLTKATGGNACTSDSFAYRHAVFDDRHDHPTHLGIYNSTGYHQRIDPAGTLLGDVPLENDRSVKLRLPAETLLLFQGVDENGFVVSQKSRPLQSGRRRPR